jgi:hypothetical protein
MEHAAVQLSLQARLAELCIRVLLGRYTSLLPSDDLQADAQGSQVLEECLIWITLCGR